VTTVGGSPRTPTNPLRLALRVEEAAKALGVSHDFFAEHIAPELRFVRLGRVKLVAVSEIERWLDRNAAYALDMR
jgi:excisionase family DNA binding protein